MLFPLQVDCLSEISHSVLALGAQKKEPPRAGPLAACFTKLFQFAKKHLRASSSSLSCGKRVPALAGMSQVQNKGTWHGQRVQCQEHGLQNQTRSGELFLHSVSSSETLSTYFILSLELNEPINKLLMPDIISAKEVLVTIIISRQTSVFYAWAASHCFHLDRPDNHYFLLRVI